MTGVDLLKVTLTFEDPNQRPGRFLLSWCLPVSRLFVRASVKFGLVGGEAIEMSALETDRKKSNYTNNLSISIHVYTGLVVELFILTFDSK